MLRDIFREISKANSPYYDTYYLTDTEIRFSINDDRVQRVLTYSVRVENDKYNAYGFEKHKISGLPIIRYEMKEVKTVDEFWEWYKSFYSDLH